MVGNEDRTDDVNFLFSRVKNVVAGQSFNVSDSVRPIGRLTAPRGPPTPLRPASLFRDRLSLAAILVFHFKL